MESLLGQASISTTCRFARIVPNQSAYILIDQTTGSAPSFEPPDCLRIDPQEITPDQITAPACCTSTVTTQPPWPGRRRSRAPIRYR